MPDITGYSFGRMEINGNSYLKDLIIFPNGNILSPWWRREGHRLIQADLTKLLATAPDIIVAGTGASGLMRPASELKDFLAQQSIEFIAQPTAEAVNSYNNLAKRRKTGACFHLTC